MIRSIRFTWNMWMIHLFSFMYKRGCGWIFGFIPHKAKPLNACEEFSIYYSWHKNQGLSAYVILGLEWPNTHQCTIKKTSLWDFMDGIKLYFKGLVAWSIKRISLQNFFFIIFLFNFFFLVLSFPFYFYFFRINLNLKPYHPSSYQPIYFPHPIDPPSSHSSYNHSITSKLSIWV
jgi:hypothetical protein